MLKIVYILHIITVTYESAYLVMRRIKTWLRSSMEQCRNNNLALINIENDLVSDIDKKIN